MNMAITKTANANDDGLVPVDGQGRPTVWCEYCGNEGVVMLEGSETVGGVEYSRGSAPCPWCDQGQMRYEEWTAPTAVQKATDRSGAKHVNHHRRLSVASDFTMYDVAATGPEPRRAAASFQPTPEWCREREAAGCSRGGIWLALGRHRKTAWPPEWGGPGQAGVLDDDASIAEKRRLAIDAKNQAEREQEGSP